MASPLIWVPKKITQDVDFAPHLKSVISRTYSEQPESYAEELSLLNRCRQDALRGSAGSDVTARDLLYKYFGQLELLELRFPELRVPFPWNDAFTQVKISQLSLAYEKASVIFNIGATLSSLAASSPRSSPEGLKRAFLSFRCASGMFTYINDNFLHAPSTDLSRDVVKVLVGLMGAQATEVFIETMGPPATKSAGLRSKMCMQASTLYGGIVEDIKEWATKGVFIKEWSHLVQTKAKYFASLAQYHRSIFDNSASKYGEALARLTLAETAAKEAHKLAQTFAYSFTSSATTSLAADSPSVLVELTKTHLALMVESKTKAQKDNDLVYNEHVPSESTLAVIDKGKLVAEPIPIHDVYATVEVQKIVGVDIFSRLVPLSVHESSSMYSEEKAKVTRAETEKVDLADTELAAALEFMGLPGSLDRFRAGGSSQNALTDPGSSVRSWAEEIRTDESTGRVEELLRQLNGLKEGVGKELDASNRDLEVEQRECEGMRVRFGHLWEQPPSFGVTKSIRQDLSSHRDSLERASASDVKAFGMWQDIRNDVVVLADPSGEMLERTFAEAVASGGKGAPEKGLLDTDFGEEEEDVIKTKVESISDGLAKLNKIKKDRAEILKDLKEKVQSDDISHLLILNRKGSAALEPSLFATELEKFRAHQTKITATSTLQQSILTEISADFKVLTESKKARELQGKWGDAERRKRELVARFSRAKESYGEVRSGVQRGLQFYQDLGMLVDGLRQQVLGFVRARNEEREQMASSAAIKQRLEGPSSTPAPLPPRPDASAYSAPRSDAASSLDHRLNALSLNTQSPPPLPPTPSQWSQPQSAYNPAPPPPTPASPYGNLPTSGPFSAAPPPPRPPTTSSYAPPPGQYSAPLSNQYSSPTPPSQYSSPSPYSSAPQVPQSPYSSSPYPQQPQRQSSLPPPPPKPTTSSFLPPPPTPINYSTYSSPSNPPAPSPYGYQSPPPQPPQHQYSAYGAPTPPVSQTPQGWGHPQHPQQPPQNPYGAYGAPPPPRPY